MIDSSAFSALRLIRFAWATAIGALVTPMLSADPVLGVHYQLNGSALEARGLGNGTLQGFGADPFVAGQIGPKALRFANPGEFVGLPSFYAGSGYPAVSVSVWVNTSVGTDQVIMSYDRDHYWRLEINGDSAGPGEVGFGVQTNAGVREIASLSAIDDGAWHHVVAVFDGPNETMEIFIDGVSDNSVAVAGATRFGSGVKRHGFLGVGSKSDRQGGATGPSNWFAGDLDDVRVYASAVTAAEVAAILAEDPSAAAEGLRAPADRDADGISNTWEEQYGLDPDNPADADTPAPDAEGGAIGATYLQQFRAGADPTVDNDYSHPSPKPVVTASVVTAEAYELEGIPAVLRLSVSGSGGAMPVFFSLGTSSDPGEGASDSSDYTVTDPSGTPLEGYVMVTPGGSSDILVQPVEDTTAEYPEVVELSVDSNPDYVPGIISSARCTISDATDIPENVTTFKAIFTPEIGSVTTSGTGFATLTMNGPNTEGTFFSTYSGLTSTQTNQHIHHVFESSPGVPDFTSRGMIIEQLDFNNPHDGVLAPLHTWTIEATGGYSVKALIDALYRQNGLSLYCNVHTLNNGPGEIWAFFEEFDGAVALTGAETAAYESPDPVAPLPAGDALRRDVARFLTQTTWGPRMVDIEALYDEITTNPAYDAGGGTFDQQAAYQQWMTDQLALDQTRLVDLVWSLDEYEFYGHRFANAPLSSDAEGPTRRLNPVGGYQPSATNFEGSVWTLFCYAHDQFRQRIALAFSEIWVISRLEAQVNTRHYGAAQWWDDLGAFGTGNWRDLIEYVSKSPMMGQYLSHLKNETIRDGSGTILVFPDENYAREIQQLFSIGLLQLLPDGRVRLNGTGEDTNGNGTLDPGEDSNGNGVLDVGNGQPIQTYSNLDIEELARVFTGWSFSEYEDNAGNILPNTSFNRGSGNRYLTQRQWRSPMWCFDASNNFGSGNLRHDTYPKSFYVGTPEETNLPAGQSGEQDLDQVLDTLLNHPNTGPFLAKLLIKRLVTSNPTPAYVYRVASVFNGGSNHHSGAALVDAGGTRGDMEKVVRAIIMDREARDVEFVDSRDGSGKSKEPAIVVAHVIRALNAQSRMPLEVLTRMASGPNFTVTPGSGNLIEFPVTGEDGDWPAEDYAASQYDNFPPDASIIHFTSRTPIFGQSPMSAPSVFNFFLPDYSPGGELAIAGLTAPELQLATETAVVDAINFTEDLVNEPGWLNVTNLEGFGSTDDYVRADFSAFVNVFENAPGSVLDKAEALVDQLDLVFAGGVLKADYGDDPSPGNPRQTIIEAILNTSESTLAKVKNALYLVVHSPAGLSQR